MDPLPGLRGLLPENRVVTEGEEIERHGGAIFTYHSLRPPDAVVFPASREEVVEVLRFANGRGRESVLESSLTAHLVTVVVTLGRR